MTRSPRISPRESLKRTALRRKREAQKSLIRARESLKLLLKSQYPTRRAVEVGDTNSDTAQASRNCVYEPPSNRRRGGGNGAPLLRSPLAYCPVAALVEQVVTQPAWVLFESPSFGSLENAVETPSLDCPIDGLNLSTQPPMSDSEFADGLSKWWAELEDCWDFTLKTQADEANNGSGSTISPEEFLFDLLT
ncbi:hypothetical protein PCASD_10050 [Puccinia coronata f. sp. avenae]|uniref:Uncharacterized protein n=1 Tax=Puccinia coronata f. sp. avenae TaxID=200324 RepID=A0A2N5UJL7_9BASI|nr:hypothetical protein PCASD_10050 [Puccinia coronata f. sp. avenae]